MKKEYTNPSVRIYGISLSNSSMLTISKGEGDNVAEGKSRDDITCWEEM